MLGLTEVTAPNTGKKRQFLAEQGPLDINVDSKRRRCENHDKASESSADSAASAVTSQPGSTTSDVQKRGEFSGEQAYRGRSRWREGSEPLDWDYMAWYLRQSKVASFEDRPKELDSKSAIDTSPSHPNDGDMRRQERGRISCERV
ncbi:hypothetical protein ACHAQJ_003750 [Trichoderma viride]